VCEAARTRHLPVNYNETHLLFVLPKLHVIVQRSHYFVATDATASRRLLVRQRDWFEVSTMVHQVLSGHASSYLAYDCCVVTDAHPEDCARLTLLRFSSVGRAPTSATEPSIQLDLESGTICRRTSDSQTCHTAASDSR